MTPYELGLADKRSSEPEPECPFTPGTNSYKEYAEGFCSDIDPSKYSFEPFNEMENFDHNTYFEYSSLYQE